MGEVRLGIYFLLVFALNQTIFCQDKTNSDTTFHQIDVGVDYATTNSAFGQKNFATSQPTIAPYILYTAPFGLSVSGMVNFIANSDTSEQKSTRSFDASIGYSLSLLNDRFVIYPSFTHFFTSAEAQTLNTTVKNQWAVDFIVNTKLIEINCNASILRGDFTDFLSSLQLGKTFEMNGIFSDNDLLEIAPTAGVFYGKYDYQQVVLTNTLSKIVENRKNKPLINPLIGRLSAKRQGQLQELSNAYLSGEKINPNERLNSFLERLNKAVEPKFSLKNIEFELPITYTINNLSISATASVDRLIKGIKVNDNKFEFMFTLGMNYSIPW